MWWRCETGTLQRATAGHWSGWECVGKIRRPHLGEERIRLRCDRWFHSLPSVSGRAVSSGTLLENTAVNLTSLTILLAVHKCSYKSIQTFCVQAGSPVTAVELPPPEVRPRPLQTGVAPQFREEM